MLGVWGRSGARLKPIGAPPERVKFQIFLGKKFETPHAGASPCGSLRSGAVARAVIGGCKARFAGSRSLAGREARGVRGWVRLRRTGGGHEASIVLVGARGGVDRAAFGFARCGAELLSAVWWGVARSLAGCLRKHSRP